MGTGGTVVHSAVYWVYLGGGYSVPGGCTGYWHQVGTVLGFRVQYRRPVCSAGLQCTMYSARLQCTVPGYTV